MTTLIFSQNPHYPLPLFYAKIWIWGWSWKWWQNQHFNWFNMYLFSFLSSCDIVQSDSFGWPVNNTPYNSEFNGIMGLFERKKIQSLAHGTIMLTERLKFVEWTGEIFRIRLEISICSISRCSIALYNPQNPNHIPSTSIIRCIEYIYFAIEQKCMGLLYFAVVIRFHYNEFRSSASGITRPGIDIGCGDAGLGRNLSARHTRCDPNYFWPIYCIDHVLSHTCAIHILFC